MLVETEILETHLVWFEVAVVLLVTVDSFVGRSYLMLNTVVGMCHSVSNV